MRACAAGSRDATFVAAARRDACSGGQPQSGARAVVKRRQALLALTAPLIAADALPSAAEAPSKGPRVLQPCKASQVSCVSSSAVSAPSKYLPAWGYPGTTESAIKRLEEAILEQRGEIRERTSDYLRAVIPYGGGLLSSGGTDDVEFLFVDSGYSQNVVTFRSIASEARAPQPFCVTPGCVNGPPNRGRMERLRDELDWVSLETDEEKKWVQIMLH